MRTLFLTLTTYLFVLPAHAAWPLYQPVAEVVLPPGDANVPRGVEEKDGYVYLAAREGTLYTYDLSDLPSWTAFATYNTPVYKQTCQGNGNGVLRQGDYLYVFGRNGIQTIDVQDPNRPVLLGLKNDLSIYNLVRHENYLLAAGRERLAVYSIAEPSNPTLVSDLNLGQGQLVWSAAGYGHTLYVCHWWSDWQDSYTNTLSIIDFSDPAHLAVLKAISRDDQAYHLRVIGDQLLECTSNQVGLWDLTAPANPVLLTSQVAGGRVAALSGDHIVTNGMVFRPDGNKLQLVATFTPGDSQRDGYPYGSAVNASFVFLAQSKRILILNARPPVLVLNYPVGGPGSFFTITGHGFPPKGKATMLVNGHTLGEVATDAAGDCLFLLNAKQAGPGRYMVTTTAHPGTSASFIIASGDPVRPQQGSGTIFPIPSGIAYTRYSGGNGTAQDPYQIATAADLIALGETPADYDKHFVLTADIDLDPKLPGRRVFDKAVIAPDTDRLKEDYQGAPFTGVFDGQGHTISHLTVTGPGFLGLFGRLGLGAQAQNLGLTGAAITGGAGTCAGGLAGSSAGTVNRCYCTGVVSGGDGIGGLIGNNDGGRVTQCYSGGTVSGHDLVGGLVGSNGDWNAGFIAQCYSTSATRGTGLNVGGLVGCQPPNGTAAACFWDTQTSGLITSAGAVGKTTGEMRTAGIFLDAGWDFAGETKNGTEDVWWILEGQDYPRLAWERVVVDDFKDGKAGPLWTLYEPEPQRVRLAEVHGRLEVEAVAQDQNVDAIYAANGWRLAVSKPFALRVDFHFTQRGSGAGRVTFGVVPALDPAGMQWAEFEAGRFDTGPFYLYEVRDGAWVEEQVTDRSSDGGTLYVSYNPDTDELYFSSAGYGKPNAWRTVRGLLKGRWAGGPVYVILSGGSEGMALTSGDAWLDNFVISTGVIVR